VSGRPDVDAGPSAQPARPYCGTSFWSSAGPAWITAAATVVLAAGAIITAYYASKAFREQSEELGLLRKQVRDQQGEREREAAERRGAQAVKVFVVLGGMAPDVADEIRICNSSDQPIYDLLG
jgi:hypothetical protein